MTEHLSDGYDAAGIAKFVSSMAQLGHYDWQAMRHITQLAKTQAKVNLTNCKRQKLLSWLALWLLGQHHRGWLHSVEVGKQSMCNL
jgi:hypothetical protein